MKVFGLMERIMTVIRNVKIPIKNKRSQKQNEK
jgi:hypothetical protein